MKKWILMSMFMAVCCRADVMISGPAPGAAICGLAGAVGCLPWVAQDMWILSVKPESSNTVALRWDITYTDANGKAGQNTGVYLTSPNQWGYSSDVITLVPNATNVEVRVQELTATRTQAAVRAK